MAVIWNVYVYGEIAREAIYPSETHLHRCSLHVGFLLHNEELMQLFEIIFKIMTGRDKTLFHNEDSFHLFNSKYGL